MITKPVETTGAETPDTTDLVFLRNGGEMGALMRAHDWSTSSLGPPLWWRQSLRTVVRLMLNTGHPMFVFWGADHACLYNDAYRRSIGSDRHPGCLGRPGREVWAEIWEIIGPQIGQVMSGGGATWHVNHLVPITRNGCREDVYWTYSFSPIDDEGTASGVGGVLVVCSETTDQVIASRQLATERDHLAELFEQSPTFMAVLRGPEHRFEIANPAYMELVGHRPVLGKTIVEAVPEAVAQGYFSLLNSVYGSGEAYRAFGTPYTRPDSAEGSDAERFVDFVFQPIKDHDGHVTGIFVQGADVTDRIRASIALCEMTDQLRQAHRAKDNFLATLSHELRNPLAPMRNALELLNLAPADAETGVIARAMMGRQLRHMVRLVDDLLDLSRMDRDLIELRRTTFSLASALAEAVETSRPVIEQYRHVLTVASPEEECLIDGDETRLVQVFSNLVNNAAKFTPPGGRIELCLARESDAWAVVSIRDNGIGIPPAMLEQVFEMYTQVDPRGNPVGGGLGIGLNLVRRLLDMHGGTIQAHSDGAATGSEFVVRLPLISSRAPDAIGHAETQDITAVRSVRRIVVADDNADAAKSFGLRERPMPH